VQSFQDTLAQSRKFADFKQPILNQPEERGFYNVG